MMGFLLKSAIGLGAVYYAMFSPELKSGDLTSQETLCAIASRAQSLGGDLNAYQGQLVTAGCAIAFNAAAQRLAASVAPAPPPPPPPVAAPAPAPVKAGLGSLTPDDLRDPWFGPDPRARKSRKRA